MTWEHLSSINWPDCFSVNCKDGSSVTMLKGREGVGYLPPGDDPSGRGFIHADSPPARPGRRSRIGLCIYLDVIRSIEDREELLWGPR